jgi:type II secretory pathway pseudopilin PulG
MKPIRRVIPASGPKPETGFSLIELVVFIVVVGILGAALFAGFSTALQQGASGTDLSTSAIQLAQERMELILAQKRVLGFTGFTAATFDPCTSSPPSTQAVCTAPPAGYTVSAALTDNWGGDTNYKVVNVSVTGASQASLTALVANY